MFSLNGAVKYILNYKDMRGGYDKLSGVVCSLGNVTKKRIKELIQVASTLLDSNTKLGKKVDA